MKKIVAMILVIAMCFSLSACGKVKVEEAIIGDWTYDLIWQGLTSSERDNPDMCIEEGHSATNTLSFFEGGTVKLTTRSNETGFETTQFNGTWEIVDGVVVISAKVLWDSGSFSLGIDTESEPYTLRFLDNPDTVYTKTTKM